MRPAFTVLTLFINFSFLEVAQMARHTGDYDTYPTNFCSETGLPDHAPLAAPQAV